MQLWLQEQATEWQVAHDQWTDSMRTSLDEDPATYDQAVAELIKHGQFLVRNSRAIRCRIIERRDSLVATIG